VAAVLTEIYLCNVYSCQEILRRNGRGQAYELGELGGGCGVGAATAVPLVLRALREEIAAKKQANLTRHHTNPAQSFARTALVSMGREAVAPLMGLLLSINTSSSGEGRGEEEEEEEDWAVLAAAADALGDLGMREVAAAGGGRGGAEVVEVLLASLEMATARWSKEGEEEGWCWVIRNCVEALGLLGVSGACPSLTRFWFIFGWDPPMSRLFSSSN
jgi:hypothetical protein